MCVLAFAWKAHPRWHVILAGNRDELHDRPALPLSRWHDEASVIAGRDLVAGGTWLGVSEAGRLAVVTNLRGFGGPDPARESRGALTADYLKGGGRFADIGQTDLGLFNPFNLIVADGQDAHFLSNRPQDIRSPLASGIYGLSNGALDDPWPKTLQIKAGLLEWIVGTATDPAILIDRLREEQLPFEGIAPELPSDVPMEARQSPVFIRHPVYGTRCSTVVAIGTDGQAVIIERRYSADGRISGETQIDFRWPQ